MGGEVTGVGMGSRALGASFSHIPSPAPGLHPNPGSTQGRVPHSSPPCRPGQGSSGREPAEMKSKQNCERRRTAGALTQEKNFSSRQLGGAETNWGPGQAGRGAGRGLRGRRYLGHAK